MNTVLKLFLSMSVSGGLLILVLLLGKRLLKNSVSRQWQYYIWLIVILRLLVPLGPEINLLGKAYLAVDQAVTQAAASSTERPSLPDAPGGARSPAAALEQDSETMDKPVEGLADAHPIQDAVSLLSHHIWLVWLAAALGMLIRKATAYQSFIRYIHAGLTPVSDIELLDRLSAAAEQMGIKTPVELCVDPLVSSPLLIGLFHPCIVLPSADVPEKDFQYIVLHELTHYRRLDMLYKWLVQVTVCVHWFNPLVHLMSREITKACEFSCDEAVLTSLGPENAQDYGRILLDAMAAVGKYKVTPGAVTLSENKQLLKERLGAIMQFKRKSKTIRVLTGTLTAFVILGAVFTGIYPAAAAEHTTDASQAAVRKETVQTETEPHNGDLAAQAERYYKAGSLPLFQMAFRCLDGQAQSEWLDRIYADRQLTFFGAAVNLLDDDCAQIKHLAETVYEDGDIVYFSNLTAHMSEDTLEEWLDRALEDNNWVFQSVLFNALDRDGEFDELEEKREKEWAEAQTAEYGAVGVTFQGKNCYYQGHLVNIFLDIRANKSFYTLDMNPAGTVNIKIVRNADNEITGVAYMTEEEITELFGDSEDEPEEVSIPVDLKAVAAGKTVFLGEYELSDGDRISYDILAETGNRMKVFFAENEQKNRSCWSVDNLRQPGEPLSCAADFTVEPPAKAGTYRLYLQAVSGTLRNVKGSISIVPGP